MFCSISCFSTFFTRFLHFCCIKAALLRFCFVAFVCHCVIFFCLFNFYLIFVVVIFTLCSWKVVCFCFFLLLLFLFLLTYFNVTKAVHFRLQTPTNTTKLCCIAYLLIFFLSCFCCFMQLIFGAFQWLFRYFSLSFNFFLIQFNNKTFALVCVCVYCCYACLFVVAVVGCIVFNVWFLVFCPSLLRLIARFYSITNP